jgi:hypothetical protein
MKLQQLKSQIVITNPEDVVETTTLRGHPSIGKSDDVVWIYEIVQQEFRSKFRRMNNRKN